MSPLRRALLIGSALQLFTLPNAFASRLAKSTQSIKIAFVSPDDGDSKELFSSVLRLAKLKLGLFDSNFLYFKVLQNSEGVLPNQVAHLAKLKPDIVLTVSTWTTQAVADEIKDIPVIFSSHIHPELWLQNLGNSNLTGFTYATPTLGKRVEILTAMATKPVNRIGIVGHNQEGIRRMFFNELTPSARVESGIADVEFILIRSESDLNSSTVKNQSQRLDGYLVITSSTYYSMSDKLVSYFNAQQKPVLFPHNMFVQAGGLASYTPYFPDYPALYTEFLKLILSGVRAESIPILTPKSFYLAFNISAAKKMSVRIPSYLLKSANEVIVA
jgi:putative tryptophan/tyrosine transport system substrate-binding protein